MNSSFKWVGRTHTTVRLEMEAPLQAGDLKVGVAWILDRFRAETGRAPSDSDYWLEPTDGGVAIVFALDSDGDLTEA